MSDGGTTYCRRCGLFQPREAGVLIKIRMRSGQMIRQFICGRCQSRRAQQRTAKQIVGEREALHALYVAPPNGLSAEGDEFESNGSPDGTP